MFISVIRAENDVFDGKNKEVSYWATRLVSSVIINYKFHPLNRAGIQKLE